MPYPNNTPIPDGFKRCSKGDQCVHPEGPILPADVKYFRISKNHNKLWMHSRCRECERAYAKYYNQTPEHRESVQKYQTTNGKAQKRIYRQRPEVIKREKARQAKLEYKIYHQEYYQRPSTKAREKARRQTPEYKAKARILRQAWRQKPENKEHVKAYMKVFKRRPEQRARDNEYHKYRARTPEGRLGNNVRARRRDAIKRNLPHLFTVDDMNYALKYWHGCCAYCGNPPSFLDVHTILHADHFIPISDKMHCPGTIPENILPACQTCNLSKGSRDPVEWLTQKLGKRRATKKLKEIAVYFEAIRSRGQS